MKLEIGKYSLKIIPETPQDEIYLEEVLGLDISESYCRINRVNEMNTGSWAYAETESQYEKMIREDNENKS